MAAKDIMTQDYFVVNPDTPLIDAIQGLYEHNISGVPVCNDKGIILGMLSAQNAVLATKTPVDVVMAKPIAVAEDETIERIIKLFGNKEVDRVYVVRRRIVTAVISQIDVLRAMVSEVPDN